MLYFLLMIFLTRRKIKGKTVFMLVIYPCTFLVFLKGILIILIFRKHHIKMARWLFCVIFNNWILYIFGHKSEEHLDIYHLKNILFYREN